MSIPAKHFYMTRHGQTEANAARIMAGSVDTPLTEIGRQQASEARKIVEKLTIKPAAIFHSHLSRAADTANIINENLQLPMFEDKDLAEIHAGVLEGAPYEECEELFNAWPHIENGEAPNDFFNRVKRVKTRAIEQFNEPVLIVCHGGVMRAFGEIHGVKTPGKFANAQLYEFTPKACDVFPWHVHHYTLCKQKNIPVKIKSEIYDISSEADAIAS